MARRRQPGSRRYPRTARLNEVVREIVAEEIERIADERLGFFTVTGVEVDASLEHAVVRWTDIGAEDEDVLAVLEEHRPRLQRVVNAQTHMRRTPVLSFSADEGLRSAERVEEILRGLDIPSESDDEGSAEGVSAGGTSDVGVPSTPGDESSET